MRLRENSLAALAMGLVLAVGAPARADDIIFEGACEASAAVLVAPDRLYVAFDEDDLIRSYAPTGGPALAPPVSLDAALAQDDPDEAADLEAAAVLGDRIFWLGSHSRNKDGESRPDRRRFISTATDLTARGGPVNLAGALRAAGFGAELGKDGQTNKALAPDRGGFNIEGLAVVPPSPGLATEMLLGLRRPLRQGQAIVVPFVNPMAALDRGDAPVLGSPIKLDLAGRGVRDIVWSSEHRAFLVLAGPPGEGGSFALFTWDGQPGSAPRSTKAEVDGLSPEAVIPFPGRRDVLLLSDDGDRRIAVDEDDCPKKEWSRGTCPCQEIKKSARDRLQRFRGRWVAVD